MRRWTRWAICWSCMFRLANEQDHERVEKLVEAVQQITDEHVVLAYVDQTTPERPHASGSCAWHPIGGGETYRGETWLRSPAPPLGSSSALCLGRTLSTPRPRLRADGADLGRVPLRSLHISRGRSVVQVPPRKSIEALVDAKIPSRSRLLRTPRLPRRQ
jgi:hypothetical protein